MKLAISNIAWSINEDDQVFALMRANGFTGLEIAPNRVWINSPNVHESDALMFRRNIEDAGFEIVSLQSLHFGRPDLSVFGNAQQRREMLSHSKKCIKLARVLNANALVFGSPKNRRIGSLNTNEAEMIARDFFSELAESAQQNATRLCIEPNPAAYGSDFIMDTFSAIRLVQKVNHPGFGLNLDIGAMKMNGEDYGKTIEGAIPYMGHCHISEPMLDKIPNPNESDNKHHHLVAESLKKMHYSGWVSIEMKPNIGKSNIETVRAAIEFVRKVYF